MQKAVPFSTNSLKLESPGDPHAAAFIAQRRRRVEKVAQSVSPVYKAKRGRAPEGRHNDCLARHSCAAPPALVNIYQPFPALTPTPTRQHRARWGPRFTRWDTFSARLPTLFEVDRCILIHLKLLIHATLRWCLGRCVAHSGPQSHRI